MEKFESLAKIREDLIGITQPEIEIMSWDQPSPIAKLTFLTPVNSIELSAKDQLFARTIRGVRVWQLKGPNYEMQDLEEMIGAEQLAPCVQENTNQKFARYVDFLPYEQKNGTESQKM